MIRRKAASLDLIKAIDRLEEIGDAIGRQISLDHYGRFLNEPLFIEPG